MTTRLDQRIAPPPTLSLPRLYLLRLGYLIIGVGLAVVKWPLLFDRGEPWPLMAGVVNCMLIALSLLAFLGLRYPRQLIPVLLFEVAWKLIWIGVVAAPRWAADQMDAATESLFVECALVVIIVAVIPWRHVVTTYARSPGDRWH